MRVPTWILLLWSLIALLLTLIVTVLFYGLVIIFASIVYAVVWVKNKIKKPKEKVNVTPIRKFKKS